MFRAGKMQFHSSICSGRRTGKMPVGDQEGAQKMLRELRTSMLAKPEEISF